MNSASFDLSITVLDISWHSISSANQVVMQISELTIRGYFRPWSHVTETQGFFNKKTERQAKTSKKGEIIVNLCHPVKCIHRLRCLHFEESCSLLIVERRF